MITLKQLAQRIEQELQSNGVDPNAQPIEIDYIDISLDVNPSTIKIIVRTERMPLRVSIFVTE